MGTGFKTLDTLFHCHSNMKSPQLVNTQYLIIFSSNLWKLHNYCLRGCGSGSLNSAASYRIRPANFIIIWFPFTIRYMRHLKDCVTHCNLSVASMLFTQQTDNRKKFRVSRYMQVVLILWDHKIQAQSPNCYNLTTEIRREFTSYLLKILAAYESGPQPQLTTTRAAQYRVCNRGGIFCARVL